MVAGGEAEFTKYGWNQLIKNKCIDIAQPEVCGLGGITEIFINFSISTS